MTAQATETILIDGIVHQMYSLPFDDYLGKLNPKPKLIFPTTACWRGYYGKWEIRESNLFLIELEAYLSPLLGGIFARKPVCKGIPPHTVLQFKSGDTISLGQILLI